ncbi:MAG: effector-associated domain EAD1-containing protein [Caldilineaceae bacterium]
MNGKKLIEFFEAMLDAFRSKEDLERMLKFSLDKNLNEITEDGDLRNMIFHLIDWAEAYGKVNELVQAAIQSNPDNPKLCTWIQNYPAASSFAFHKDNANEEDNLAWYGERLIITVADKNKLLDQGHIPGDSQITAPAGLSNILNFTRSSLTWTELTQYANKEDWKGTYWIEEIEKAIVAVASNESPEIMTSTFRGRGPGGRGRIFRPILLSAVQCNESSFQFHFFFNEVIVPELVRGPGAIGEIFNLLRIGTRTRWEVIEPFLKFQDSPERESQILAQVNFSLRLIELEIEKYNVLDEFLVPNNIFNETEQKMVDGLLEQRARIKGQIQKAIDAKNFSCLMHELKQARELNIKAMALASKKYYEMLAQDCHEIQDNDCAIVADEQPCMWQLPANRLVTNVTS